MTKRKLLTAILLTALASCLVFGLIFAFGLRSFARAEIVGSNGLTVGTLDDKSKELNNGYLDRYGIPTSGFTYTNNGGAESGAPLSYAFDRNFNSVWRSQTQTKEGDPSTVNTVTVTFERAFEIDRIVYQADSSWYDRGYFNTLTLSYTDENGVKVTCGPVASRQTDSIVLVTLKERAAIKSITLEWTKVPTNHRTVAAASEIIFLQPESKKVEDVQSMFTDYAQLTLDKEKIKTKEDVEKLRERVKDYATYDSELSYLLTRAEQVLDGAVFYEPRREMSTSEDSPNPIARHGDVAGYARNSLKFAWFGTNRQATGINAVPGDNFIIYVTGNEGDPLPSVIFSQHWGSWRGWKSGEYKLRLGKNVFEVPNYLQDGYTDNEGNPLVPGGPVYIVNPYTADKQSSDVKIYFEGGDLFPVFREDGDESAYKKFLADYADSVAMEREENSGKNRKVVDVTEIVSDRAILTVRASTANDIYNNQSYSPQSAVKAWDEYIDRLLQFDGIVLENDGEKLKDVGAQYDERNRWLNVNIRLAQPYGAAYAFTEHVGIQVGWEAAAIAGTGNFGWGYTHELGHMMDINERTVSECSNNMISKFQETAIEKTAQRGDFAKTAEALSPDDHIESYWNTNRGNFLFWWLIESYYPGFWARLDNLYRYTDIYKDFSEAEKKELGAMNATEKQVCLSSLAVKEDLSYYFERWGYNLSTNDYIFKADGENTSAAFRKFMKDAKEKGLIKESTGLKFWYLDAAEWLIRYPDPANGELYHGSEVPEIKSVTKSGEGYNLIMDIEGEGAEKHLGFEILEGSSGTWKVIGFTYDKMFLDVTDYGDRTPKYKVVAYDRALKTSAESSETSPTAGTEGVCELNGTKYSSLYEAVAAAQDGDVIKLLKNTFETGILIDKKITVQAETACTITKGGPRPIFTVGKKNDDGSVTAGSLNLVGPEGKLTLDGGNISTDHPLIFVQGGVLNVTDCVFTRNTVKRGPDSFGGALRINGGTAAIEDCIFESNSAGFGGGVYIADTKGNYETKVFDVKFTGCTFKENAATEGGAVYNKGSASFSDCNFEGNTADTGGGISNMNGGVIFFFGCAWTSNVAARGGAAYADGRMDIYGGSMTENIAKEEGAALYILSSNPARALRLKPGESNNANVRISENDCKDGSAIYLAGNAEEFTADVTGNRSQYAIYFGGTAKLKGGKIGGTIFKDAGAEVSIADTLPEADGEKIMVLTNSVETRLLLFSCNFTISEGEASRFETARGNPVVRNQNEIWLEMESYTVTFIVNGEPEEYHFLPDYVLTLDARSGGYGQKIYVTGWTDEQNVFHEVGEEIVVSGNMTFTAKVENKFTVTFEVDEAAETESIVYYVMPRESFTLPRIDPLKYVFSGWELGGTLYKAYATAFAEKDITFTAKLTKKLAAEYVIVKDGNRHVYETRYYAYGSKLSFVRCGDENLLPDGGYIEGFYMEKDGVLSDSFVDFDTYTVQTDVTLVANVVDRSVYIMYFFLEDGHFWEGSDFNEYEMVPYGSTYTVSLRTVPFGYHVVSLELNGVIYTQEALDGLQVELVGEDMRDLFITANIEKNAYNVTYQINGTFFKSETRKFGEKMVFEDPTDTLLKEALGEEQYYSFNSYQILTVDPFKDMEDLTRVHEMNIMIGDEIVITEDITINMLVYIEGQEKAPEADFGDEEEDGSLAEQRFEKKALAQEMANALIGEVSASGFNLTDGERSEIITEINRSLAEVLADLDGADSLEEMETAIGDFGTTLAAIKEKAESLAAKNNEQIEHDREEADRNDGVIIQVRVSGIVAIPKIYDGTSDVALDLSGVVYLNAATGLSVDPDYSKNFKLRVTAVLPDKNAGIHTAVLIVEFDGGEYYALAETGQQETVTVEVHKAKLSVSLDEAGNAVYSGFVNGEDESVLSGELTVDYTEENGVRMATPGGLASENYEIEFIASAVAKGGSGNGPKLGLILGISIPAAVLLLGGTAVCILLVRKKRSKKN